MKKNEVKENENKEGKVEYKKVKETSKRDR